MDLRAWNRRKNNWLRVQKGKWVSHLLGSAPAQMPYDANRVHKVLLLRNDNKLGDAVVCSALLHGLKKLFPGVQLDVVSGRGNAVIFEHNPDVSHVYKSSEKFFDLLSCGFKLRKEKYDLYIDLDEQPTLSSLVFLKGLAPRWAFGFNREQYPLYNLQKSMDLSSLHITKRQQAVLELLGATQEFDTAYRVVLPTAAEHAAEVFLKGLPQQDIWLINPLAASRHRSFSVKQVQDLAACFPHRVCVLIGEKTQLAHWCKDQVLPANVRLYSQGIFEIAALARHARVLLTPDTFWVHMACALQIPTVAVYQYDPNGQEPYRGNVGIWRPLVPCVKMLFHDGEQSTVPVERLELALQPYL